MQPHFMIANNNITTGKRDGLFVEFSGGIKPILDDNDSCVSLYNDLILHAMCDSDKDSKDYELLLIKLIK